jgi:hypothetical protein
MRETQSVERTRRQAVEDANFEIADVTKMTLFRLPIEIVLARKN